MLILFLIYIKKISSSWNLLWFKKKSRLHNQCSVYLRTLSIPIFLICSGSSTHFNSAHRLQVHASSVSMAGQFTCVRMPELVFSSSQSSHNKQDCYCQHPTSIPVEHTVCSHPLTSFWFHSYQVEFHWGWGLTESILKHRKFIKLPSAIHSVSEISKIFPIMFQVLWH